MGLENMKEIIFLKLSVPDLVVSHCCVTKTEGRPNKWTLGNFLASFLWSAVFKRYLHFWEISLPNTAWGKSSAVCFTPCRCLQAYDSLICTGDGGQIVLITSPANRGAVHPRFPPLRKSSILFSLCLSFLHKRSSALCQIVLSLFLVSVLTKLGTHLLSTSFLCDVNIL